MVVLKLKTLSTSIKQSAKVFTIKFESLKYFLKKPNFPHHLIISKTVYNKIQSLKQFIINEMICVERRTEKKFWVPDGNLTHDLPYTIVGCSNHWATENSVVNRSVVGWHNYRIAQSHYQEKCQLKLFTEQSRLYSVPSKESKLYVFLVWLSREFRNVQ